MGVHKHVGHCADSGFLECAGYNCTGMVGSRSSGKEERNEISMKLRIRRGQYTQSGWGGSVIWIV